MKTIATVKEAVAVRNGYNSWKSVMFAGYTIGNYLIDEAIVEYFKDLLNEIAALKEENERFKQIIRDCE